MEIFNLLRRESETFLFIVFLQIIHILDGFWFDVNCKDVLIETIVHTLQHLVVFGVLAVNGKVLFDTADAFESHVLCDLYGIGGPWGYHFAAWTNEESIEQVSLEHRCLAIQPI